MYKEHNNPWTIRIPFLCSPLKAENESKRQNLPYYPKTKQSCRAGFRVWVCVTDSTGTKPKPCSGLCSAGHTTILRFPSFYVGFLEKPFVAVPWPGSRMPQHWDLDKGSGHIHKSKEAKSHPNPGGLGEASTHHQNHEYFEVTYERHASKSEVQQKKGE